MPSGQPLWRRSLWPLLVLGALALVYIVVRAAPIETSTFPTGWNLGLRGVVDDLQDWVIANRASNPIFVYLLAPLSAALDVGMRWVEGALLATSWLVVVALFAALGYLLSGLRLALLCAALLTLCGAFGLWEQSMQTLALMAIAVLCSVAIAIPLGILAAASNRFDRATRPVLDAMQTMPAFVYLIPLLLLFGVGRVPAAIATVIYAVPPALRLTNLGIRQVSPQAVEAARAFGSTRRQVLLKVQLPLALPSIMAGVNQTIMMALGIVVIAALVGAGGLGREVVVALDKLEVGQGFEAGLAIVFLAIVLDRLSAAVSELDARTAAARTLPGWLPASWPSAMRRAAPLGAAGLLVLLVLLATLAVGAGSGFPTRWRIPLRVPVDWLVDWMKANLYRVGDLPLGTGPFSDFLTIYLLNPMRALLRDIIPWPVAMLGIAALAYRAGGWRMALLSLLGLLLIGLLGMWELSMETLSQVLVTVLCAAVVAIPLGVLAAENLAASRLLRPLLDFLQTVPTFVYLLPVIMLFNVGRVPGLIAAALYAIPPGIKLTELGLRHVDAGALEAARAFGSSRRQALLKVRLPLALPSVMLAVNQMILMVLAMVIIAGLVGSGGLGLEVVTGLRRVQTGRGLEAGLAIVILAVLLDRITQAWSSRYRHD
jgi:glycine betaine/proline transport system permease protein